MQTKPDVQTPRKESVVIKKYANRRLYNTETSTYVTLEDLAQMVRSDRDFVVYDAKSGDDLTHGVLTQIIVEQESREGGLNLLPIPFLRQLIRFYDDQMGKMVPGYLQFSLESLVRDQENLRSKMSQALTTPTGAFDVYQELARKNMVMFEQAMSMWSSFASGGVKGGAQIPNPFFRAPGAGDKPAATSAPGATTSSSTPGAPTPLRPVRTEPAAGAEIDELKDQLAAMQQRIERLSKDRD